MAVRNATQPSALFPARNRFGGNVNIREAWIKIKEIRESKDPDEGRRSYAGDDEDWPIVTSEQMWEDKMGTKPRKQP
jgi:hypothetical protein